MNEPRLADTNLLQQLRSYGMPIKDKKANNVKKPYISSEFLTNLRIQDESDYIQRYKWYNLPKGMTQELLERMFYYRSQVACFYDVLRDELKILPYVLNGSIDEYGRYTGVSMLPFNGTTTPERKIYIPGEGRIPIYDVVLEEELTPELFSTACVLCNDYCKQMSQTVIPRQQLQEAVMKLESEVYPMARTALIANSGIKAVKVSNTSQQESIQIMNQQIYDASMDGDVFLSFVGDIQTQALNDSNPAKCEEYLMYLQSLENQRLSQLGLVNGGIFQKKAHELQSENDMITSNTQRQYNDGLVNRQIWCTIINSIWADPNDPETFMWVEPAEAETMQDRNFDGEIDNGETSPEGDINATTISTTND